MDITWRMRRQLAYLAIPIIPVLLIGVYLIFDFYTTATCEDGKLNQGEVGIDCEGPCSQICAARIKQPDIIWSRAFQTQPGIYSLAALIENKNDDLILNSANVLFEAVNESGAVVYQANTVIDLLPLNQTMAFIGPVSIPDAPTELLVTMDLSSTSWRLASVGESQLIPQVVSKQIEGTKTEPEASAVIRNVTRDAIKKMPVGVVILDENNLPVAASSTLIDIAPEDTANAFYTWPRAFPTTTGVCQQPVDVVLAIDASGSMNSVSENPPEPLTSVKTAAKRFAGLFSDIDRVGVVTFANNAEVVQGLSTDVNSRVFGVESITITAEAEVGYTNISAALETSRRELSQNQRSGRGQAIVLLTDGLPTAPDGFPDPEISAIGLANQITASDITLFTIGLGKGINEVFLNKLVSGDQSRVFKTSNVDELSTIYSQIASAVCERSPYGIEVYPSPPLKIINKN